MDSQIKPTIRRTHFLTNENYENRTANCSLCGKVTIYFRKCKNQKSNWICYNKLTKPNKNLHKISYICEKSKTGQCVTCGLVRLLKRYSENTYYWVCNRKNKGKADRKKAFHRSHKKTYCEICNFQAKHQRQLDIHHIDHNHSNDDPSNFKTVCFNCHRIQHLKTFEELDEIRQATLLNRRWLALLNQEPTVLKASPLHKNTKQLVHKFTSVCEQSRTAFCAKCGLVSINLYKDKQGYDYWTCNHGGKKAGYGKENNNQRTRFRSFIKDKIHCEDCGFIAPYKCQLDIHHKDGDHNNNCPSNFKILCANCHRLEHTDEQEDIGLKRFCEILSERWMALIN